MARPTEFVRGAVKVLAAGADAVRSTRGVVVLIYHRVGGATGSQVDLPVDLFEQHLAALAATGRVVSLDAAVAALTAAAAAPAGPDPVVVTFDDGAADFVDVVHPMLHRYGVPAYLYVATSFVDSGTPFPWGAPPASWSGLSDVVAGGLVGVGSHTHTHVLLDRVPVEAARDELDRSIDLIGAHLGQAPAHFAYPKAAPPSAAVAVEVAARFTSAALAGCRPNRYGRTDVMRLARSPIQRSDGVRWFRHKLAGGMATEDDLRRLLNRRRYANAVT